MATGEVTAGRRNHSACRAVESARGDILADMRDAGTELREETRPGDSMAGTYLDPS